MIVVLEVSARKRGLKNDELQRTISSDECGVCLGAYDKDIKDGELLKEWIQCTDSKYHSYFHTSFKHSQLLGRKLGVGRNLFYSISVQFISLFSLRSLIFFRLN